MNQNKNKFSESKEDSWEQLVKSFLARGFSRQEAEHCANVMKPKPESLTK